MTSINSVILKSLFMFLFFLSFIACIIFLENLILYKLISNEGLASIVFLIGMFLCTATKNVPLNNKLADFDFNKSFLRLEWNHTILNWNHI